MVPSGWMDGFGMISTKLNKASRQILALSASCYQSLWLARTGSEIKTPDL